MDELNNMIKRNQDALGGFSINTALEQFQRRNIIYDKYLESFGEHPLMKETKGLNKEFHIILRESYGVSNPSESVKISYKFPNGLKATVIYGMYSMNRWEVMATQNNVLVGKPKRCKEFSRVEEELLKIMFK